MTRSIKAISILALAAFGPAIATASAAPATGVVLKWDRPARIATVALSGGRVVAVTTNAAPKVGSAVALAKQRRTRSGIRATLARRGFSGRARIRGTVLKQVGGGGVALSTSGGTILVHLGRSRSTARRSNTYDPVNDGATVVGDVFVDASGDLESDDLVETSGAADGQSMEIDGTVAAIDTTVRKVTISLNDGHLAGNVVVNVPPASNALDGFVRGRDVTIQVTRAQDGTLTLSTLDDPDRGDGDDLSDGSWSDTSGDQSAGDQSGDQRGGDHRQS